MSHDHELHRVAKATVADLQKGAQAAAKQMIGDQGGPDGEKVSKAEMLDYVRRNWTAPEPLVPDPMNPQGRAWRERFLAGMIPSIPNPYATKPEEAEIPAANGVKYAEELLNETFPFGYDPAQFAAPVLY